MTIAFIKITNNQPEANLESVKSKEGVKSKETEKIANKSKMKTLEKIKVEKNQKQSTPIIKTVNKIFHKKLNASSSQEKTENNDIERE